MLADKITLLVLTDAFWPDQTGEISKSLLPKVEELTARGHRVVVVPRKLKQNLPFHESRDGYELYRYPSSSKGSPFSRLCPLSSIRQVPRLLTQLHREFRFDVASAHNPSQSMDKRSS